MDCVLSLHNISPTCLDKISSNATNITLRELNALGLFGWLKKMRFLGAENLYVFVESDEDFALLPVFRAVASTAQARKKYIVFSGSPKQPLTFYDFVRSGVDLLQGTIEGQTARMQAGREIRELLSEPLQSVSLRTSKNLWCLQTNLWFGLKAGGSVGHIAGVVNALMKEQYRVDYLAAYRPVMVDDTVNYHGIRPSKNFGLPVEINYYRYHYDFIRQAQMMDLPQPSFVYQRLSACNFTGPILARSFQVPLVIEYNGSEAWIAKNWARPYIYHELAVQAEEVCLRHAHLNVVVSDVLKEELLAKGIPEHRIVSYPNCIDPQIFAPGRFTPADRQALRAKYGIAPDAALITFVGTFGRWHGVDVLAKTIRQMVDSDRAWLRDHKVHFLLVGDGVHMTTVKAELADAQYEEFFTLTGLVPQAETPAYLAASDILVSPHIPNDDGTRFFGSPTKLFEYMAMGKGIVASDLEQIGVVLKDGLTIEELNAATEPMESSAPAVLTKPGSVSDLMQGIRFLVTHPAWRERMGENARKLALSKYTWKEHVRAILNQLEICIKP